MSICLSIVKIVSGKTLLWTNRSNNKKRGHFQINFWNSVTSVSVGVIYRKQFVVYLHQLYYMTRFHGVSELSMKWYKEGDGNLWFSVAISPVRDSIQVETFSLSEWTIYSSLWNCWLIAETIIIYLLIAYLGLKRKDKLRIDYPSFTISPIRVLSVSPISILFTRKPNLTTVFTADFGKVSFL